MNKILSLLPRNLQFWEEAGPHIKVANLMVSDWTQPVYFRILSQGVVDNVILPGIRD